MIKRKIKTELEQKLSELKMNLENNYKDQAHAALKELQTTLDAYWQAGELKEKDYRKYKQTADHYAMWMQNYHH